MRRWFIQQESDLFRYRFCLERIAAVHNSDTIDNFLNANNLCFEHIMPEEAHRLRDELDAGTALYGTSSDNVSFYKVI